LEKGGVCNTGLVGEPAGDVLPCPQCAFGVCRREVVEQEGSYSGVVDVPDAPEVACRQDARLLISLMARDGLLHSPTLQAAISAMRASTARLFDRWITAGLIPAELGSPQDLALSFTGPIGLTRVLHLHADATAGERATARDEILRHVETFARAVFR
jgi:hypothetical protein